MTVDLQKKLELVRAAIERIKDLEARWCNEEARPAASSGKRAAAHRQWTTAVHDFGWRWRNVEALLDGLTRSQSAEVKP